MINIKYMFPAFLIIALIQIAVPLKMIWDKEQIITHAKAYKFKTAPVDPSDPFRGKYISLRFDNNTFPVRNIDEWYGNETVYVTFKTDQEGYSLIDSVLKFQPEHHLDYLKTKISYINDDRKELNIDFPFDRYYMEESKAYPAETIYRDSQMDSTIRTYALVHINDGQAVLSDVLINDIPIKTVVEEHLEKESAQ